ncbi:hypothetical protein MBM_07626 [Drepanopeziza brunnea f. sp. 'multigermtubi' MB_m1]|uniref:Uncharacterized protein n=1 Tax=Marssonina brunnea f. sp. multigermtubi (strain MB_m1) TaxID=1072389 RepID=K1WN98_MARBU|nr:uncharacterized protein MBM_07626 [Drepanopeziza brunnea f. sp. 'multigermtubi' MB_m1]EKD14396.1 hypothetical protein MBM_07626 [Drepanopeziza brunnea f. sp. 'multigermtubi' MB_m1]
MLRTKSILATLLALNFLFDGAYGVLGMFQQKRAIGYATIPEEVALRINEDNKLLEVPSGSKTQLGPGLYLVNHFRRLTPKKGDWYCAVKADAEKVQSISKVYIPKSYVAHPRKRPQPLWYAGEDVIMDYLMTLELMNEPRPSQALRFSWVSDKYAQMQMLIPDSAIDNQEALELWAECFETEEELTHFAQDEDFINWENKEEWNIMGDRGLPEL